LTTYQNFSLSSPPPAADVFTSEPIAVTTFLMDSTATPQRANWLVSNEATTTCSFRWEGSDNQVIFSSVPRINRSKALVASSWTSPAIPLPENSQVNGFQVNVYATASTQSCTIDLIRFGVNETNAIDFQWRQFMVTDGDSQIRRYVYRNMTTRLAPEYRLSGESLITPPGHLSIIMTHSNNLNGSCWVDCIELQLLYTQTGKLTVPPGETTTAVGASSNNNNGTLAVVTGSTAMAASNIVAAPETVPADVAIGLGVALGLVLLIGIIAVAVCMWRRRRDRSQPNPQVHRAAGAPAVRPPQPLYQSANLQRPYDSGNLQSPDHYEMLAIGAAPDQTEYVAGTEFTAA